MLNQSAIAEIDDAMLGNVIVVSSSSPILLALLKHFTWGPIGDILKKREGKIASDLDSAKQSRINSAKMEQECERQLLASRSDAAGIIKNAKESGESSRQSIPKDARGGATRLKSKAQTDITVECDSVLNSVRDDVAELSSQIAEKILNKELSPEMHESLINQYTKDLGSSSETR